MVWNYKKFNTNNIIFLLADEMEKQIQHNLKKHLINDWKKQIKLI
jgi:hypothetical protein